MSTNPYQKAEETIKDTTSQSPVESVYTPMVKTVLYNEARRIQKIVSALYLITDLFDQSEPLKGQIRSTGVRLISLGNVPDKSDLKDTIKVIATLLADVDTLMSFIEIARLCQKISDMNASIITRELGALNLHLSKRYQEFLDQELATTEDAISKEHTAPSLEHFFNDAPALAPRESVSTSWTPSSPQRPNYPFASANKKIITPTSSKGQSSPTPDPQTPEEIKESRKRQIIDLVKDRGEVSIKDIAPRIVKCSEKTLQRDLQELIASNILKKTGDRRWSKYSMNVPQ